MLGEVDVERVEGAGAAEKVVGEACGGPPNDVLGPVSPVAVTEGSPAFARRAADLPLAPAPTSSHTLHDRDSSATTREGLVMVLSRQSNVRAGLHLTLHTCERARRCRKLCAESLSTRQAAFEDASQTPRRKLSPSSSGEPLTAQAANCRQNPRRQRHELQVTIPWKVGHRELRAGKH